jgi:glycine hydroxymethyltransferase
MGEELLRGGVRLVGGGTDTHLLLVDLTPKNLTGKAVEEYLDGIAITANKNAIPYDPQKPAVTSGLRLGSAAITTRGMGKDEAREIAKIIVDALGDIETKAKQPALRARTLELTSRFEVP